VPELRDHLSHLVDTLEHRHSTGSDLPPSASTGFGRVDQLTGGLGSGGWLIRGAAGTGTTAVLATFVSDLAFRPERAVIQLVTADLSPHELTLRLVACSVGIPLDRLRAEELAPADWPRLTLACRALSTPDVRITDARGWSQPELDLWCVDQRPADAVPTRSWLVIDAIDRLSTPGVLSLPRLERLSGRQVVATTSDTRTHHSAAATVTTLWVDELGHRTIAIDRARWSASTGHPVGISIHATTLRARDHAGPLPGPGQLQLG